MHHFVFLARLDSASPGPRVVDHAEITDCDWFALGTLPRPISDFTTLRIEDALAGGGASYRQIGPRKWSR